MRIENTLKDRFKRAIIVLAEQLRKQARFGEADDIEKVAQQIGSEIKSDELLKAIFLKHNKPFSNEDLPLIDFVLDIVSENKNSDPVQDIRPMHSKVNAINVLGSVQVNIIQGSTPRIKVFAQNSDSAKDLITEISGSTLTIQRKPLNIMSVSGRGTITHIIGNTKHIITNGNIISDGNYIGNGKCSNSQSFEEYIEVTLPEIKEISLSGSSSTEISIAQQISLNASVQGSGVLMIEGSLHEIRASVQGSGNIHAEQASIKNGKLNVQGSGSIRAKITDHVTATVAGSGTIKVFGQPLERHETVLGSGKIKFK